jgi:Transcriptional regulator containing PAS, AAA-type ATPase, and DNA-binding domains
VRQFKLTRSSTTSYGGLIEKVEILRSALRWASKLEQPEIQKLLVQCNALRDEVMLLSRKERFIQASLAELPQAEEVTPKERRSSTSPAQRRQALIERNFIFEGVFGESPKLLEALEIAEKAAPTELPVLIDGESGTGKELLAKVMHANGNRADKPFISVNCGAIPNELLESELFGHKKGSFTGAVRDRKGKFESAHEGTIFLDEVGELPLHGQVKLLRVLQSNEIQRVGSDETINVDTRVVAATNRNLLDMTREGRFREDLYYRLSVIRITLPPLRERPDEIPLLIDFFSDEAAEKLKRRPVKLTARLRNFLMSYSYPGNIRELRNIIFRLSCLAGDTADLAHLPEDIRPAAPASSKNVVAGSTTASLGEIKKAASDEAEKLFLEKSLREVGGKVVELAKRTGMNRSHLQTLLKKHGLNSRDFRAPRAPTL